MKSIAWMFSCLVLMGGIQAQQFGGNPPSLKWRQINNDTVRIIFPVGQEKKASEIASIAQMLANQTQHTLGTRLKKIDIVLQNQTMVSNGYVGLGPRRSEFFLTPMQNSFELGSIPWHQTLALHEYRHVQQYNNFDKGISKLFHILTGELGLSFANSTAIPNWFWEGDAVYQETIQSRQGRGRLPYFFNGYRSLWAANKDYAWLKLRNGSLRDYVPNHYQLGYLLAAYGRKQYGDSIWRNITDDAARFRGLFYPFQHAVQKYTGKHYREFRKEALNYFEQDTTGYSDSAANWAASQKHFVADEEFPYWIDDQSVVFVKSSYKKIPAFIIRNIHTGAETKLRVKDISPDNYFSYRNGRIVYAAYLPDLRWGWCDYTAIRLLDISSGDQRTITTRHKYFSPDINQAGDKLVAVEVNPEGSSRLQIIDATTGNKMHTVPNPDSLFYTYPKFYGNNQLVTAVRNTKGEMALALVNMENGDTEYILPFSTNVLGLPTVNGDTISFTASYGKQDQLFAWMNKKLYWFKPVNTNRAAGNYQLGIHNNLFGWSEFTAAGFRFVYEKPGPDQLEEIPTSLVDLADYGIPSLGKSMNLLDGKDLNRNYITKKYAKGSKFLNFHSWLPSIDESEYTLSLIGENILNTHQSTLYFTYNTNEESKKIGYTSAYGAFFPWIRVGAAYTFDRSTTYNGNQVQWDEWELRGGLALPLNFSGGRYYRNLRIASDYVYSKPEFKQPYKDTFDSRGYGYIDNSLFFVNLSQQARMHIYPRWGQTLQMDYSVGATDINGNQLMASVNWYFPGLFQTHNLVINTAIHQRDTMREIFFTNNFPFSRGYDERNFHQMLKLGVNYHLPLIYPDWGFGSIVYFLRLRVNAFYDYSRGLDYDTNKQEYTRIYRSYGAELFFDTKWWNQQAVSFGIRYSHLLDGEQQGLGPHQWEIVLPVNLIGR